MALTSRDMALDKLVFASVVHTVNFGKPEQDGALEEHLFDYRIIVLSAGAQVVLTETVQCPTDQAARELALCLRHHGHRAEVWRDGALIGSVAPPTSAHDR